MAVPNAFEDVVIQKIAEKLLGQGYEKARARLRRVGELALGPVAEWAVTADKKTPEHIPYDNNANRIDEIRFHPAYRELEKVFYGEGAVAAAYDPRFEPEHGGAPHSLALLVGYLLAQGEAGLYCPVCMTDGAARLLVKFDEKGDLARKYVPRLAATAIEQVYSGAMFLTEKQGGSDVGQNSARAVKDGDAWKLYGEKWFCSNASADVVMVLARPDGAPEGTKGLGLFVMPRTLDDGTRNAYRIDRLKDKLGVRSMPTAEITLEGARAWQLGGPGQGFKQMAEMLNLSRLYNAVTSGACMSRALFEARRWCEGRVAFGKKLTEHPMVADQLEALEAERAGTLALVFEVSRLLDKVDAKTATDEEKALWRMLTPLAKMHTGKAAVRFVSECLELLGGNGYIEDWPLARVLRDAQVLPIWEGSSNILALDTLRAASKVGEEALSRLIGRPAGLLAAGQGPGLRKAAHDAARLAEAALVEKFGLSQRLADRLRGTPFGVFP